MDPTLRLGDRVGDANRGPTVLMMVGAVFDCVFDCAVTDRREVFTAPQHYYSCFEAGDHGEVTPDGSV